MSVGAHIVYQYELFFDGADPLNGSLYLDRPLDGDDAAVNAAISTLQAAGLWSSQPAKQVADNQRKAYAEQMRFIACVELRIGEGTLLLARYTHPKFASDERRWQEWIACLAA